MRAMNQDIYGNLSVYKFHLLCKTVCTAKTSKTDINYPLLPRLRTVIGLYNTAIHKCGINNSNGQLLHLNNILNHQPMCGTVAHNAVTLIK